jgi:hypothetical protein
MYRLQPPGAYEGTFSLQMGVVIGRPERPRSLFRCLIMSGLFRRMCQPAVLMHQLHAEVRITELSERGDTVG